jgi:hypothetical protein
LLAPELRQNIDVEVCNRYDKNRRFRLSADFLREIFKNLRFLVPLGVRNGREGIAFCSPSSCLSLFYQVGLLELGQADLGFLCLEAFLEETVLALLQRVEIVW